MCSYFNRCYHQRCSVNYIQNSIFAETVFAGLGNSQLNNEILLFTKRWRKWLGPRKTLNEIHFI